MAVINKTTKIIDITRLGEYDVLLKGFFKAKTDKIEETIGTVPTKVGDTNVANLIEYLTAKVAEVNKDAVALEKRVKANEDAIGKENTAAEGAASNATGLFAYIDDAAAEAIAKVVAGASTSYDTLVEIEQWIKNDTDGAASMQKAIKVLQGTDGSTQTKDSASILGVKLYIDSLVSGKNVEAAVAAGDLLFTASAANNKVTVGTTEKLQSAVTRAENSVQTVTKATSKETYVTLSVTNAAAAKVGINDTALSTKIDAMYADMQGNTTATVKNVEDKVNYLVVADAEDITGLFD